jgi:hypothetical protein
MDQQSASRLREELSAITVWMAKKENIQRYLSSPYETPTQDYMDRVSR